MAKKVPIGKRFQKGQVANPLGGRAHNPEVKKIKKLTREELVDLGSLLLKVKQERLTDLVNDPETPGLKAWIASVAERGIKSGNMQTLDALLDRLIGKVEIKAKVDLRNPNTEKTDDQILKEIEEIHAILKLGKE